MSVQVTINLWWLLGLYVAGAMVWAVIVVRENPWNVSGRGKPPFDDWRYTRWGVPLAVALNAITWPWWLVRNLLANRRRRIRAAQR